MKKFNVLDKKIINKDFGKKTSINDFSLSKIGNHIKEARISRNQSINELASILKISEQQLKAIEEGREDLLPEKVFIRAMVKRISEKLKLDIHLIAGELNDKDINTETKNLGIEDKGDDINYEEKPVKRNPYFFISVVIISGLVGLFSSSFIFNKLAETFNESNTNELINQN